jgi:lipopolysaccharide/colanic/teichoic acid biosynthesis glycosyltransferase
MTQRPVYLFVKRSLDILLAGVALLFLLPFFLPLALLLRLTGEGDVLYRQVRIGFKGKPFGVLKFVTMRRNSENIGTKTITTVNDLKGDMSIVGPRPQTEECYGYFPETDREKIYWSKPGLTGMGSVVFRNEEELLARSAKGYARAYREDIMPYKQALELWYWQHRSLLVDLKIILLTAIVVLFPETRLATRWFKGLPAPQAPPPPD